MEPPPQPSPDGNFSQENEDKLEEFLEQKEYEDPGFPTLQVEEAEGEPHLPLSCWDELLSPIRHRWGTCPPLLPAPHRPSPGASSPTILAD